MPELHGLVKHGGHRLVIHAEELDAIGPCLMGAPDRFPGRFRGSSARPGVLKDPRGDDLTVVALIPQPKSSRSAAHRSDGRDSTRQPEVELILISVDIPTMGE